MTAGRWRSYAGALATGLLVITGGALVLRNGPEPCVTLHVTSSTEKFRLVEHLAGRFRPGDGCVTVRVQGMNSGVAAQALADGWAGPAVAGRPDRPHVWLPTSTMWVTKLRARGLGELGAAPPSLAHSPLVIAMRRDMATSLGWPARELTWRDVLSLDKDAWAARGHPEWDRFTYAKDDPTRSTSGLAATVAAFYSAAGKTAGGFTVADARSPEVRARVRQVEANVVAHPPDIMDFLGRLSAADAGISAMVVQEELLYLHNQGNPTGIPGAAPAPPGQQFVAIHPADGTLILDHPYAIRPGLSAAERAAADDFLAFLREPEQRQAFADLGFRDEHDAAPPALAASLGFDAVQRPPAAMPLPSAEVMDAVLAEWKAVSKRANILLVLDKSGSMGEPSGIPGAGTRMAAAKRALADNLRLLNPDDRVELWSFASDPDDLHPQLRPPTLLGNGADLTAALAADTLAPAPPPHWDTALCVTVRDAQRALLGRLPPGEDTLNAVVVLTDGKDEYDRGDCAMTRDGPGDYLGDTLAAADPRKRVRVFGIAFGPEADEAALREITTGTGGVTLDATGNPSKIGTAFADIFATLSPGRPTID